MGVKEFIYSIWEHDTLFGSILGFLTFIPSILNFCKYLFGNSNCKKENRRGRSFYLLCGILLAIPAVVIITGTYRVYINHVRVPDIIGLPVSSAVERLRDESLYILEQKNIGDEDIVMGTLPKAGELVKKGTKIEMEVSNKKDDNGEFSNQTENKVIENNHGNGVKNQDKVEENTEVINTSEEPENNYRENIIQDREHESNNSIEEANSIEVNHIYQGRLESDNDVDYYRFSISQKGNVHILFKHEKIDRSDRLWEIYLIDGNSDAELIYADSNGGTTEKESDTARIAEGEYYIKIKSYYYSDKNYSFMIVYEEESNSYEKELNNQIDCANVIDMNCDYIGNMQTNRDVDYYKISTSTKGKITISFEHEKIDTSDRLWEIYLLDEKSDREIISLFSGGSEGILQSDAARIPAGNYYIKIKPYYYSNCDYKFKVNFIEESEQFENESNDTFSSANKIAVGTVYVGNLQTRNDYDYYSFELPEIKTCTLNFSHEIIDRNERCWEVYVLDSVQNQEILKMFINGTEGFVTATAENVPAGTYYIKIKSYCFDNSDYTFWVN